MKANLKNYSTFIIVFIIILCANIPLGQLQGLIWERSNYKSQVENEIIRQWGDSLNFGSLKLSVPYEYKYEVKREIRVKKDEFKEITEEKIGGAFQNFAAKNLDSEFKVNVEKRYKGIYEVPIFRVKSKTRITFSPVTNKSLHKNLHKININNIKIFIGLFMSKEVTDIKAQINGKNVEALVESNEIYLPIKNYNPKEEIKIDLTFNYNGTKELLFKPTAKKSNFNLISNWKDPKFIGDRLPSDRVINKDGFKATWEVQNFGNEHGHYQEREKFGVELINVLDIYHLNERTLKYGILFIMLTTVCIIILQFLNKTNVHPIQFIFIMISMVEFYFILLSLSEHISFNISYLCASLATIITLSLYTRTIFKEGKVMKIIVGQLSLLYTFLFLTVASSDYALLIGSIGLFFMIGAAMYATRKLDWDGIISPSKA